MAQLQSVDGTLGKSCQVMRLDFYPDGHGKTVFTDLDAVLTDTDTAAKAGLKIALEIESFDDYRKFSNNGFMTKELADALTTGVLVVRDGTGAEIITICKEDVVKISDSLETGEHRLRCSEFAPPPPVVLSEAEAMDAVAAAQKRQRDAAATFFQGDHSATLRIWPQQAVLEPVKHTKLFIIFSIVIELLGAHLDTKRLTGKALFRVRKHAIVGELRLLTRAVASFRAACPKVLRTPLRWGKGSYSLQLPQEWINSSEDKQYSIAREFVVNNFNSPDEKVASDTRRDVHATLAALRALYGDEEEEEDEETLEEDDGAYDEEPEPDDIAEVMPPAALVEPVVQTAAAGAAGAQAAVHISAVELAYNNGLTVGVTKKRKKGGHGQTQQRGA